MLLTITPAQVAFLKKYFGEDFHTYAYVTKPYIYFINDNKRNIFDKLDIQRANFKNFEVFDNYQYMPIGMITNNTNINDINKKGLVRIAIPPSSRK